MKKEIVKSRLLDFQEMEMPNYIKRDISINHLPDMITTIVGVRKSGKTYLTYQLIDELIKNKFIKSLKQVCYLHFDDEQLSGFSVADLHIIDEIFYSLFETKTQKKDNVVFVFDEIHKIKGWENFVLRIKKKPRTIVIVTGSSADLEADKVNKQLRGKTFTNCIYPLSFKEFLKFKGEKINIKRLTSSAKSIGIHYFDEYCKVGCFPAVANISNKLIPELLKNYFISIVQADFLFSDFSVHNLACKDFVTYLLHNNGGKYTHKKTFNSLRSFGHNFSKENVPNWYELAKNCYFVGETAIYSNSAKKIQQNYRKVYCVDWQLANSVSFPTEKRKTATLESIVYWELIRRKKKCSYYLVSSNKLEIDFLVYDIFGKPETAIQVSHDISSPETFEREIKPFNYIKKEFPNINCLLLTENTEMPPLKNFDPDIKIKSVWKWLLD